MRILLVSNLLNFSKATLPVVIVLLTSIVQLLFHIIKLPMCIKRCDLIRCSSIHWNDRVAFFFLICITFVFPVFIALQIPTLFFKLLIISILHSSCPVVFLPIQQLQLDRLHILSFLSSTPVTIQYRYRLQNYTKTC